MRIEPQQLKAFLLDFNLITDAQFERVQKKAEKINQEIGDILVSEKQITREQLINLEAYILGIPFINLEKEVVLPKILRIIPESIARTHNIVAFRKEGQNLEVAMLDPKDLQIVEFIAKKSNLKILPRLTNSLSIKSILKQYHGTIETEFSELIEEKTKGIKIIKEKIKGEDEEKEKLQKTAEELPIIRIFDTLIRHAILQRASDVHIEPLEKELLVRFRINGILQEAMILPKQIAPGIVARVKVLSSLKLDEHRLPQDGRFKIKSEDWEYSIRVSILPVFKGEKVVMRLLSETTKAFSLEDIGLRGKALEDIYRALKKPLGMILVTGPTGSGKTTTLYSAMAILNTPKVNISTIEDPIEYQMPRINQIQVNSKIGLTFVNGLRSLVRQDPDIIMVGEIRDNETASLSINAALTGHLVLSTLHTNTAAGAISRLIDMKCESFLISSTLNVILAQRLIRRLTSEKEKYFLKEAEIENFKKYCNLSRLLEVLKREKIVKPEVDWKDIEFYRPKASKKSPEGYEGRIGIYEVLNLTDNIKELIIKQASSDQIQDQAQKEGMRTMIEDGFIKAVQGLTSIEEVLRVIVE